MDDIHAEELAAAAFFASARAGDGEAFGRLLELYRGRLEALAYLSLGPRLRTRADHEDIVQETFIKAFEIRHEVEWQGSRSFFRWLARILGHAIQNEARRHKDAARELRPESGLPEGVASADLSPLKMLRRNERFERLEKALNELSADRREALVCAHIHGLSTKDIARRLGRSPGAVGVLLHRARKELKMRFGDTESLHLPARALAPFIPGGLDPTLMEERRRGWRSC
jgi:RNA polymerase sigma-70 factor (ECF subfamily)